MIVKNSKSIFKSRISKHLFKININIKNYHELFSNSKSKSIVILTCFQNQNQEQFQESRSKFKNQDSCPSLPGGDLPESQLVIEIQYAPKSWTCQFRQLRGVASESKWQHHCIYSLWAGEWNNITNFSTDGCRNPQKMPNYSFGIFQFLAKFLKIIVWNQNRCCWLGSVYIFH